MTPEALLALIQGGESEQVEFTQGTQNLDKVCEDICAFANDLSGSGKPGFFLIGVTDNGGLAGLEISDQFLVTLASIRTNGSIIPFVEMSVERVVVPDGQVAVIRVLPSSTPPVRYKGRVHIRVGPRKGIATNNEECRLSERAGVAPRHLDARVCRTATIKDLDEEAFLSNYLPRAIDREALERNGRPIEQKLAAVRFFSLRDGCPTFGGLLTVGKQPTEHLPGAYVQYLKIDGTSKSDPIETELTINGNFISLLARLESLAQTISSPRPVKQSPFREDIVERFPSDVLRELLLNAVIHRSYESAAPIRIFHFGDRVEIQSPGGLYGTSSVANFPWQNDYRNPLIATVCKHLGYVNRFGLGVIRSQEIMRERGLPELHFQLEPEFVRVVVAEASEAKPE